MPKVKVGDINMYYEVHGEGEPLVLVTGVGGNLTRWFRSISGLSKEYQVIVFDNRGMGRTDIPDIPYSMEMMADDTVGLMDAVGIDKAYLFGHSMGGVIGQCFGLRHPDRLICLMLGSTIPGGHHSAWGNAQSPVTESNSNLSPEEQLRLKLTNVFSQRFIENNPDVMEEIIRNWLRYPIDPAAFGRQWDALMAYDAYDRLPEITAPTLVIHGSDDQILLAENGHTIASRIPGAELVIMEGVGHNIYSEAPEELNRILINFMKRHSTSKA
ncbi:MAG TPA: alpha/beta hydrolase [Dehalococcoidia bacterium]|nr:alpha/beta hydrolase [Dehalococcoidia bacterium]